MTKLLFFKIIFICPILIFASSTRIMPLGDSITYDDAYSDHPSLRPNATPRPSSQRHGYRNYLWYQLQNTNFNVKFVGSRIAGEDIIPAFDPHNEGYPGWTSAELANITYEKLVDYSPDVILLHIGSNDWDESISGVNQILNEIERYEQTYKHHIKIILALIINRPSHYAWISNFNYNLQNLTDNRILAGDDIVLVDMEHDANLNYNTDFQDPTHPNDDGYKKMANLWFNTLQNILPPIEQNPLIIPFIKRFYTTILLREGDNSGITYWNEQLQKNILSAADLARGFIFSEEFSNQENDDVAFIKILYNAFFNRVADSAGNFYWLSQLEAGLSRYQVLNGFLYSKEFSNLTEISGILAVDSAELFISRLYTKVLQREAEQQGIESWINLLRRYKTNATSMAQAFFFSEEFLSKNTDNTTYITLLYQSIFNRTPELSGLLYWVNKLEEGESRLNILNAFTHSQEFKTLARQYDIDL